MCDVQHKFWTIGLKIFYSDEKDWAGHTKQQSPLQALVLRAWVLGADKHGLKSTLSFLFMENGNELFDIQRDIPYLCILEPRALFLLYLLFL